MAVALLALAFHMFLHQCSDIGINIKAHKLLSLVHCMLSSLCFSLPKAAAWHLHLDIPSCSHMQGVPSAQRISHGQRGRICPILQTFSTAVTSTPPAPTEGSDHRKNELRRAPKRELPYSLSLNVLFILQIPEFEKDNDSL